jgi:putative transposase
MKRKQFSEEQIIGILKEAEAGAVVAELCRRHGMSSATFYAWKAKFGGMEVSDARRLRALEEENARLKRLLADTMLDNAGLKDLLSDARREAGSGRASPDDVGDERAAGGAAQGSDDAQHRWKGCGGVSSGFGRQEEHAISVVP